MINFNEAASAVKNINTGNIGDDPIFAEHLASASHKRALFGKAWDVGDQGTVFYPFRWIEDANGVASFKLHTAAFFGHDVSEMKTLGTAFLRSNAIIDEHFNVIGNGDLAYQFSRIAPLLLNAQREKEIKELQDRDWSLLGQAAYQTAYKKIEEEYDTKENMKAKRPLIGKLRLKFVTECVYVSMDVNAGSPNFKPESKTGLYIQEARDSRRAKLNNLANDSLMGILAQNPGLVPEADTIYFLEVLYNFTSAKNSKAEAGRVDPQGLAPSLKLATRFPDCGKTLKGLLEQIPKTSDDISAHTYGLVPVDEASLAKKLQSVLFQNTPFLPYLPEEDRDRLVGSASLFDYLRIAPKEDADLNEKMAAALGHPVGQAPAEEVPTFDTIMNGADPDFSKQPVSPTESADTSMLAGLVDDASVTDIDLAPSQEV